jgi:hypothetical protein
MSEDNAPLHLRAPREPVSLQMKLRTIAAEDLDGVAGRITKELSLRLWRAWSDVLRPAGVTPRDLRGVLADDRREAWLWVMGDRTWGQFIDGLIGRTRRRLLDRA